MQALYRSELQTSHLSPPCVELYLFFIYRTGGFVPRDVPLVSGF